MTTFRLTGKHFKYLVEHVNDSICICNGDGNIKFANKAFKTLIGLHRSEVIGKNILDFVSQENHRTAKNIFKRILGGKYIIQPYELYLVNKNGQNIHVQVKTELLRLSGQPFESHNFAKGIYEEQNERIRPTAIIDGSSIPSFVIDKFHRVTHWNTAIESMSGISKEKIVGTKNQWQAFYSRKRSTLADLIVDGATDDQIEKLYQEKQKPSNLIQGAYEACDYFPKLGNNGKWLNFTASPIKKNNGEIIGAIETLQDVTEEKRLQDNMHYYTQLITRAQEEERKRIARELHDDVSLPLLVCTQSVDSILYGSKIKLPRKVRGELESLRGQMNKALEYLRQYAQHLRPGILDHLGLIAALVWMVDEMKNENKIQTYVKIKGNRINVKDETQLLLFRIAQEALTNIRRHAEASRATLALELQPDHIKMTIRDNGKGFLVPKRLEELASQGRLGIMGMSERAKLLGGTINIKSSTDKGTEVVVKVPV